MTTLLVFVGVAVVISVVSYFGNAGFGDRKPPTGPAAGELGGPWSTVATPIDAVRAGHTLRISGRIAAVLSPFGATQFSRRWSVTIRPSDAGGTRARFIVADDKAQIAVEIPYGTVETITEEPSGWVAAPAKTPALVEGAAIDVYGTARMRPSGLRGGEQELVVVAAYVAASGEPPPSK
jgi:hypothetical protein